MNANTNEFMTLNNQSLFYGAGLLSTAASVSGVFGYLMVENNAVGNLLSIGGFMSVGGAISLGLSIYFGWEVAFNHKGITKRITAALIAISAATLSGYTIYQNTAHPILERQHNEQVEQTHRLQQQQNDFRTQMEDLRQQNKADTASIETLQASHKKGADWQVAQLRKAMDARNTELSKLSERVESYTKRLTTSLTEQGKQQTQPIAPTVISWAMLVRASSYEVMTALFLLFGSWYKTARHEQENAQATALQAIVNTAEAVKQDLQNIIVTCNKAFVHANTTANRPTNAEKEELDQEAVIYLLKNKTIQATDSNNITPELVMAASGWGRPRAIKSLERAWQQGDLERKPKGRGWTYCYPTKPSATQESDLSNVFQLTTRA